MSPRKDPIDPRSPRIQRVWAIHKFANKRGSIITTLAAEPIADFTENIDELRVIVNLLINVARRDNVDLSYEFVVQCLEKLCRIIASAHRRGEGLTDADVPTLSERL